MTDQQVKKAAQNYALFSATYSVRHDRNGWVVAALKCDAKSGVMYRPIKDDIVAGPFGNRTAANISHCEHVIRAVLEAVT